MTVPAPSNVCFISPDGNFRSWSTLSLPTVSSTAPSGENAIGPVAEESHTRAASRGFGPSAPQTAKAAQSDRIAVKVRILHFTTICRDLEFILARPPSSEKFSLLPIAALPNDRTHARRDVYVQYETETHAIMFVHRWLHRSFRCGLLVIAEPGRS